MQRFAADGGRRVLYYEGRMEGSEVLAPIEMPEDGRLIDLERVSLKWVQLLTTLTRENLSSYLTNQKQQGFLGTSQAFLYLCPANHNARRSHPSGYGRISRENSSENLYTET